MSNSKYYGKVTVDVWKEDGDFITEVTTDLEVDSNHATVVATVCLIRQCYAIGGNDTIENIMRAAKQMIIEDEQAR